MLVVTQCYMLSYLTQCSNPVIIVSAFVQRCRKPDIDLLKQVQTTTHCAHYVSPNASST